MREGWVQTTLGDIATLLRERNGSKKLVRVMTVSAADGLIDQEKYFNKSVASSNLTNYRVVNAGDFVYNKSTSKDAPMGVIIQWNGDGPVLVSPIYLVFRTDSDTSIDSYLKHYFKSDRFFASLQGMLREGARAHGALNVRQDEFLSAELVLPSLHEQRRIVDIMDSVDAAISAAQAEADATAALLRSLRDSYFTQAKDSCRVEDEFLVDAGKPLNKRDAGKRGTKLVPYIRAGSIDEGFLNLDVIKEMPYNETDLTARCLVPGDVVLVEGGNGYGKSAVWSGELDGEVGFQNHVIRLRAKTPSPEASRWIFHWTRWSHQTGRFRPTGTGLPNMGLKPVRSASLPRITDDQLAVLDGAEHAMSTSANALDYLRELRSSMLTVLLSGEHEIPESYDQFLTESVEAQAV